MHPLIAKTFGGLSKTYYVRQFLFGLIFPAFMMFIFTNSHHPPQSAMIVFMVLNTILYPYSRFVYESVMGFVVGNNVFIHNALFMIFAKAMTMALCWVFAIVIAPIGLTYLYFHHSKGQ